MSIQPVRPPPPVAAGFLRSAVVYLLLGLALGLHMAITHDHRLQTVHVHAQLLGWATMGLCGLAYGMRPALAASRLAVAHAWLHQGGLPLMLAGLAALRHGVPAAAAGAALGAVMVTCGLTCFAVRVLRTVGTRRADDAT